MDINNEIESMTATKTEGGYTLRIPEGQKHIRAGFGMIRHEGLRLRFACDAVNMKLEREAIHKAIRDRGFDPEKCQIKEALWWRSIGEACVKFDRFKSIKTFFGKPITINAGSETIFHHNIPKVCSVKIDKVDEYIADKIPDRCLESMAKAMEKGIKWETLRVAYPVIETVVQKDPIILSVIGIENPDLDKNSYVEIDMWE